MSESDKGFLAFIVFFGVIGCLFGAGYALNEGYATSKVFGHGLIGLATGAAMPFVLVVGGLIVPK